jgi:FkbM family methyltransferase
MATMSIPADLRLCYGVLRSAVIYHGNPAKRIRARRFYRQFVPPGGLAFDIGAHVGDRTGHFLALGARVVAVEPQPHLARLLRFAYGRNERLTLVAAAIGGAPGTAVLRIPRANPTVASTAPEWVRRMQGAAGWRGTNWDMAIEVPIVTLAELVRSHGIPDFCKLDIEGSEVTALAGLDRALPALSVEYLTADLASAQACLDRLGELGPYRFNYSPGETMRLALPQWTSAGGLMQRLRELPPGSGDIYARLDGG